jgi:hypothetical protein
VFLQIAIYKALGQQDDHKVRGKTGFLRHLYIKRSFYQDRLGTNIRENSKKPVFSKDTCLWWSRPGPRVRETPLETPFKINFILTNTNVCQDRLGTYRRKRLRKEAFSAGIGMDAARRVRQATRTGREGAVRGKRTPSFRDATFYTFTKTGSKPHHFTKTGSGQT